MAPSGASTSGLHHKWFKDPKLFLEFCSCMSWCACPQPRGASGKTMAPLIFLLHHVSTPSEKRCISTVCDSLTEKPYRSILRCLSCNRCCDPIVFILQNKRNSQISGMLFGLTFGLPSTTTQNLSAKTIQWTSSTNRFSPFFSLLLLDN